MSHSLLAAPSLACFTDTKGLCVVSSKHREEQRGLQQIACSSLPGTTYKGVYFPNRKVWWNEPLPQQPKKKKKKKNHTHTSKSMEGDSGSVVVGKPEGIPPGWNAQQDERKINVYMTRGEPLIWTPEGETHVFLCTCVCVCVCVHVCACVCARA